jgi:WD40 repeat protein
VGVYRLGFDTTGRNLWYLAPDGQIAAWDWERSVATPRVKSGDSHFALSRDDRWVAFHTVSNAIQVASLQGSAETLSLPAETSQPWALEWSPDNTHLAVGLADGNLVIWDLVQVRAQVSRFATSLPGTAR